MKLGNYLHSRRESAASFARRSGLQLRVVQRLANKPKVGCNIRTAHAIVKASAKEPAPGGYVVRYEDLG